MSMIVSNITSIRWICGDLATQRINAGSNGLTSDLFSMSSRLSAQFVVFVKYNSLYSENGIQVILKQFNGKPLEVSVKLWIENTTGQKFNETFVEKHVFSKVDDYCGCKEFSNNDRVSFWFLYEKHETFYICCELVDLNAPKLLSEIFPVNADQNFYQNQWSMYEDEEFHDATVKVGETEFKVSKFVFGAQSSVFKNMFKSSFKEGRTSTINVEDVDEETMKHLIKWMYANNLEENSPIEKLFAVADKYNIELLKEICTQRMLTTLNGQNAFQRLIIASLHNDDQLKNASLDCISGLTRGNIANFTTSSEWHELYIKNPGVANDVGKLIRDKLNTYV